MATTITVSSILANVAQLIGVPPFSPTTNVTNAQALVWCQQALESLQAMNAQTLGADHHHISSINLPTQPNINFVSLPSDSIEVFDVLWNRDAERSYRLLPAESPWVLPLGAEPHTWGEEGHIPRFRIEGTTLVLFPPPAAVYQLCIWYGQAFGVSAPSSTLQGRLDWQNWIELDVAIKCLVRKRRLVDVGDFTARRDQLSRELFSPGRQRMRAGPTRIQDVEVLMAGRRWWDGY